MMTRPEVTTISVAEWYALLDVLVTMYENSDTTKENNHIPDEERVLF
jgi:hypothetical protein